MLLAGYSCSQKTDGSRFHTAFRPSGGSILILIAVPARAFGRLGRRAVRRPISQDDFAGHQPTMPNAANDGDRVALMNTLRQGIPNRHIGLGGLVADGEPVGTDRRHRPDHSPAACIEHVSNRLGAEACAE